MIRFERCACGDVQETFPVLLFLTVFDILMGNAVRIVLFVQKHEI